LAAANKSKLNWAHIEAAYKSAAFANMRQDISGIRKQSIARDESRLDLICPFEAADVADYLDVVQKMRRAKNSEDAGIQAQPKSERKKIKNEYGNGVERPKRILQSANAASLIQAADDFRNDVRLGRRK